MRLIFTVFKYKNYIVVACKMFLILCGSATSTFMLEIKIEGVEMENNKKKFSRAVEKSFWNWTFQENLFCICSDIKMQFAFEGGSTILRTCAVSSNCRIRELPESNHEVLEKILKIFAAFYGFSKLKLQNLNIIFLFMLVLSLPE